MSFTALDRAPKLPSLLRSSRALNAQASQVIPKTVIYEDESPWLYHVESIVSADLPTVRVYQETRNNGGQLLTLESFRDEFFHGPDPTPDVIPTFTNHGNGIWSARAILTSYHTRPPGMRSTKPALSLTFHPQGHPLPPDSALELTVDDVVFFSRQTGGDVDAVVWESPDTSQDRQVLLFQKYRKTSHRVKLPGGSSIWPSRTSVEGRVFYRFNRKSSSSPEESSQTLSQGGDAGASASHLGLQLSTVDRERRPSPGSDNYQLDDGNEGNIQPGPWSPLGG